MAKTTSVLKAFRTPWNYSQSIGEVYTKPSLTRPNLSLTVTEMLQKHTQGYEVNNEAKQPMFFDFIIPDPKTLDLVELQEMRMKIDDARTNFQKQYDEKHEEIVRTEQAAAKAAQKARLENARVKRENQNNTTT